MMLSESSAAVDVGAESLSPSGRRVYVGNLAWRVKWQDLKDHMRTVGEPKFVEIIEVNGRSRGCGIVEYADSATALKAQQELNDTLLMNRRIFVREDREPHPPMRGSEENFRPRRMRPESLPRYEIRRVNEDTAGRQLYVANLPWKVTWRTLKDIFGGSDLVDRADVASDQEQRSRGFGFVVMKSAQDAEEAIARLNGFEIEGRALVVKMDNGPPPRQPRD